MILLFNIDNQRIITANSRYVVADSREYLRARFVFSGDWDGCTKTAIFAGKDGTYEVLLTNDECTVPHEVLTGRFGVSVYGVDGTRRITTDTVYIAVQKSGFTEGETPSDPTPTVYEQLLNEIEENKQSAEADTEAVKELLTEHEGGFDHPDKCVTTDKIADYSVTTVKIAQGAVNNNRIANGAVNARTIENGAVTAEKLSAELAAEIDGKAEQTALMTEAETRAAADAELESSKADKTALNDYYTKAEADGLLKDKVDMSSLSSYYTKTETDTKIAEAKSIIPKRYIADTLPTEGIDTNGTYLVPAESPNENNLYDEYAYINGAWEKIGSAVEVDLSGYYTKTEMDTKLTQTAKLYQVEVLPTENIDENGIYLMGNLPQMLDEANYDIRAYVYDGTWRTVGVTAESVNDAIAAASTEISQGIDATLGSEVLQLSRWKADKPTITTPTGTSAELSDNTEARFGEVASLTLTLPTDTTGDYISSVAFTSGATATSLTYPDTITMIGTDCIDGVFAPVANKRYTVIVAYDGAGLVGYVAGREVTA